MDPVTVPIAEDFFCDGHYYLLTSSSLGGSAFTPAEISEIVSWGDREGIQTLLRAGVVIPLCFEGDCALDHETLFVVGDLTPEQEENWIAKIETWLNIPCGKFVLLCGGACADEIEDAIALKPPDPHYRISQSIEVPPGSYGVEIFAYYSSMTVQVFLDKKETLDLWYQQHRPGMPGIGYIIRFSPLTKKNEIPPLEPETGWVGVFNFRQP